MVKLKNTKKYSFMIIVTILIISMLSMLVYGNINRNPFTISANSNVSELKHGETGDITYTITPNPIKFKDNLEKDVVLVLDTSQTVDKKQKDIKDSANKFIEKFLTHDNYKNFKLGIVSYNEKAEVVQGLTQDKEKLKTAIDNVYSDSNIGSWMRNGNHLGTNIGDAFRLAISMLGNEKNPNKERIVIFMSNGMPNAFTGKFYKGPESELNKNQISSLNDDERKIYDITSLSGNENEFGNKDINSEEVKMNKYIEEYKKYFYLPNSIDQYSRQDFQKRGLRDNKVDSLIWDEYKISGAKNYIKKIYKNKSIYSINVLPNNNDGKDDICYYMGAKIGYAYSLKMAKEIKDLGISTYPIYFDKDGGDNNKNNNDARENTMKLISKFSGNEEGNGVTSINTVYSSDIQNSLNKIFEKLDKNINESYSVNDAKLTINIPEGIEIDSINYAGQTIKVNKEDVKNGKYELPLNNLSYEFDKSTGNYIYNGKPLTINVTIRGINTSGSDKNCSVTGYIDSKSIEDGKKTELPNININVKSGIKVEITVNDYIGQVGEKYDSTYIKPENGSFNFIKDPKRLIGNGIANISVNGIQEKRNEDYWIKTWFTKENSQEEINPEEFKLNNINSDIDLDKENNLTYQSYNVEGLQATQDKDEWNNRDIVFAKKKNKGILAAKRIATEPYEGFTKDNKNKSYLNINNDVNLTYEGKNLIYKGNVEKYYLSKKYTCSQWSDGENQIYYYPENNTWYNINSINIWNRIEKVENNSEYNFKHNTIFYDEMNIGKECDLRYPGFQYKEADKYWGYIRPENSGWYLFGTYSDDGSRFSITKDGKTYELSKSNFGLNNKGRDWYIGEENSNFKVHGSSFYSSFTPIYLEADKYYPIQLEYFNWGGGGAFKLGYCKLDNYDNDKNGQSILKRLNEASEDKNYKSLSDVFSRGGYWNNYKYNLTEKFNDYLNNIHLNWIGELNENNNFTLYPSKSNEPGDIADEVFEGKSGVKLPTDVGVYTMHYNIITRKKDSDKSGQVINDNVQSGKYGKFEVKDLLDASISVVGTDDKKEIYLNEKAKAIYKMIPNDIKAEDIIRDGRDFPKEIRLIDLKINGMLPNGIKFDEKNNPSINLGAESNGERRFSADKLDDIIYTLENGMYVGQPLSKEINVSIESNGPFEFKSSENKAKFNLNYEDKKTKSMFEEFKGNSIGVSEPTKVIKFGILDSASPDNIKDVSEGVQVVNGMPLKIAILADVKSPNSIIDLGFDSKNIKLSKNTEAQFKVKIYNKGNLSNSEKEITINSIDKNLINGLDSGIKISGLSVGEKVIVIELTPDNITANSSALLKTKVENSSDKEYLAKLNYAEMPDVF